MKPPYSPEPTYRGNKAITILRLLLWFMPALFVPLVALLGSMLSGYLPILANISLMLLLLFTATVGIGLFEESLRFQQMRIPQPIPKYEWITSAVFFALLQIAVAPAVCFAFTVGYGLIVP